MGRAKDRLIWRELLKNTTMLVTELLLLPTRSSNTC